MVVVYVVCNNLKRHTRQLLRLRGAQARPGHLASNPHPRLSTDWSVEPPPHLRGCCGNRG